MLTISNMTKAFGDRVLFEDVALQVNRADRLGLVGPNGAGKSTLFNLILGRDTPDTGNVVFERQATVGYLPQETAPVAEETVLELALAISPEAVELQRRMKAFEAGHDRDADDYHDVEARYEAIDGYRLEPKAKQILRGLAFRDRDFDRAARTLSGGWVMRAYLARLLVQQPDLLMLDEPTNHLDLEALRWLQIYLKGYPGAILLISHDRAFLNDLVGGILDIRQRRVRRYRGNYDEYLVQREAEVAQQLAAYKNQQREIQRLQSFADRFGAKASKAAQAQSKRKQIERMDKIEAPAAEARTISIRFPQPPRSGRKVITLSGVGHAYGETEVYRGLEFEAERGQRLVLVGPNGAGKSTLLKLLGGVLPVQSGKRELGLNVRVGYYAQYRIEMLQPGRSVLEEALSASRGVPELTVRTVLGSFLFSGDDVFKHVEVLSGGEKSRLALVKLLLDPPNLLLMDEPTTHLDMASIDALIEALEPFEGTLIFISHDVHFIRRLGRQVLHVENGQLTPYAGDYQYYLDRTAAAASAASAAASAAAKATPAPKAATTTAGAPALDGAETAAQKRAFVEARQTRQREARVQQRVVDKMEREIARLEELQKTLSADLEKPETYQNPAKAMELNREVSGVVEALECATAEWEAAASRLHELVTDAPPAASAG
ncbi:MAG: ABC-F family ATP-binding cassette domain-containing protein [Lentisphaerae bacterium]|nr:ABC-F family ATP-binding cassette domain-containing protein [Lentisphaerota bacterium]